MKRIKLSRIFSIVLLALWGVATTSCDGVVTPKYQFTIFNNSSDTICTMHCIIRNNRDTIITAKSYFEGQCNGYTVKKFTIAPGDSAMDEFHFQEYMPMYHQPPLQIMVFKKSTLDSRSQAEIIKKDIYDNLYLINITEDFVASKYKVVYED